MATTQNFQQLGLFMRIHHPQETISKQPELTLFACVARGGCYEDILYQISPVGQSWVNVIKFNSDPNLTFYVADIIASSTNGASNSWLYEVKDVMPITILRNHTIQCGEVYKGWTSIECDKSLVGDGQIREN